MFKLYDNKKAMEPSGIQFFHQQRLGIGQNDLIGTADFEIHYVYHSTKI